MSSDLQNRVMDAMLTPKNFIQIHQHIDGKCEKSYAFFDTALGVYQYVVADSNGAVVECRPIENLIAWARERMEQHSFKCSCERLEHGHA